MTQVASTQLGESLGTDWSHFATVRRVVDEEVVPVIGPY